MTDTTDDHDQITDRLAEVSGTIDTMLQTWNQRTADSRQWPNLAAELHHLATTALPAAIAAFADSMADYTAAHPNPTPPPAAAGVPTHIVDHAALRRPPEPDTETTAADVLVAEYGRSDLRALRYSSGDGIACMVTFCTPGSHAEPVYAAAAFTGDLPPDTTAEEYLTNLAATASIDKPGPDRFIAPLMTERQFISLGSRVYDAFGRPVDTASTTGGHDT